MEEKRTEKNMAVGNFVQGLARVKINGWGFVDKEGKEIIPCKYDYAEDFSN